MKKFFLCLALLSGLSLCSCDFHHHHPPPNRGFRPVPPPGHRPSFGPPRGSPPPCCGPPRGGYNRPSNRPPMDTYRPYWPKDPNQGNNYDYQSPGTVDIQFQSLRPGNPSTGEVTVSSYFPVGSDSSSPYTSSYNDHSHPSYNGHSYPSYNGHSYPPYNGHSYHNHHRPPYKPAFNPSQQIYTGPGMYGRPSIGMVPPAYSGQGPDYSSPMYAQTPADLSPIYPDQPNDLFSFSNQPNQNLDIFSNVPQEVVTSSNLPANLAPIFDSDSASIGARPPIDFSPQFPNEPSVSSPIDFWLPSGSIPSPTTTSTTLPPFRLFSMNNTRTTTTTTTTPAPLRTFPPTVAPIYNNSLALNNVSVVVADDDLFDRVFLDNNNCSNVFPLSESDELLLSFSFASNLTGRCVMTFTGPSEGLKVAMQISNVTLMKDNSTKVNCEKQSLGVFSHKAGNLFKMEQLCGLERNSAILLTDSQSPLITLTFVDQPPTKNNTTPFAASFNMQLFTYALQNKTTTWP